MFGISHHVSNQAFMHTLSLNMKDDPYERFSFHDTTYSQLNRSIRVTLCQPLYCPSSIHRATKTRNRPVRWNDTHFLHCQVRQQIVNSICNPWAICNASTNHCENVTWKKNSAPESFLLFFDFLIGKRIQISRSPLLPHLTLPTPAPTWPSPLQLYRTAKAALALPQWLCGPLSSALARPGHLYGPWDSPPAIDFVHGDFPG